ncbi:filamentous hemagglutinin family protein, partial [Sinobacterium caligoides]
MKKIAKKNTAGFNRKTKRQRIPLPFTPMPITLAVAAQVALSVGGMASSQFVNAAPTGGVVVEGTATITPDNLKVIQTTPEARINWADFSVGLNQDMVFEQPTASSITVNNVTSSSPSNIFGSIEANGKIVIVNSNGIIFHPQSTVNVGAIVASTLALDSLDFDAKTMTVKEGGGNTLRLEGSINAASSAHFISNHIVNSGSIGSGDTSVGARYISLNATNAATITFDQDGYIGVSVDSDGLLDKDLTNENLISNSGDIQATHIVLKANESSALFDNAVNNTGLIKATGISTSNGTIRLSSNMGDIINAPAGEISVADGGSLDAGAIEVSTKGDVINSGKISGQTSHIVIQTANLTNDGLIELTGDGTIGIEVGHGDANSSSKLGTITASSIVTVSGGSGSDTIIDDLTGDVNLGNGNASIGNFLINDIEQVNADGQVVNSSGLAKSVIVENDALTVDDLRIVGQGNYIGSDSAIDSVVDARIGSDANWHVKGNNNADDQVRSFTQIDQVQTAGTITNDSGAAQIVTIDDDTKINVAAIDFVGDGDYIGSSTAKDTIVDNRTESNTNGVESGTTWSLIADKVIDDHVRRFSMVDEVVQSDGAIINEAGAKTITLEDDDVLNVAGINFVGDGLQREATYFGSDEDIDIIMDNRTSGPLNAEWRIKGAGAVDDHMRSFRHVDEINSDFRISNDSGVDQTIVIDGNDKIRVAEIDFFGDGSYTGSDVATDVVRDNRSDDWDILGHKHVNDSVREFFDIDRVESDGIISNLSNASINIANQGAQLFKAVGIDFFGTGDYVGNAGAFDIIVDQSNSDWGISNLNTLTSAGRQFSNINHLSTAGTITEQGTFDWSFTGLNEAIAADINFHGITEVITGGTIRNDFSDGQLVTVSGADLTVADIKFTGSGNYVGNGEFDSVVDESNGNWDIASLNTLTSGGRQFSNINHLTTAGTITEQGTFDWSFTGLNEAIAADINFHGITEVITDGTISNDFSDGQLVT